MRIHLRVRLNNDVDNHEFRTPCGLDGWRTDVRSDVNPEFVNCATCRRTETFENYVKGYQAAIDLIKKRITAGLQGLTDA